MVISPTVSRRVYLGLFSVALATLMFEILLTRIFSVTMWYHFAFMAISVAMFGMTVGALAVYLLPNYFTQERTRYHLSLSALWFSITIIFAILTHCSIPFVMSQSFISLYANALNYAVIAIPFIFSGVCVTLALTRFPAQIGRLYAADLAGAALGCILLIVFLEIVADALTAVIGVAFLASLSAYFFGKDAGSARLLKIIRRVSLFLCLFTIVHAGLVYAQSPLLRLVWVKGSMEGPPLYEKWDSFSRVRVVGNPDKPRVPFGWGFSDAYVRYMEENNIKVRELYLAIDAVAGTPLTHFEGNFEKLQYLKYDITNLVHEIRPDSNMLIIGSGGGRDVLSGLLYEQASIRAVEINENILNAVNNRFAEFTGHLYKQPRVTFVNDEARSYIARQEEKFDIIQASLIDTWAATAAGAFVMTENSLYTVDAWEVFLNHLTPDGVLTFSRWYFKKAPWEMYRLASLAVEALKQAGIENPRDHFIIARNITRGDLCLGTVLLSKTPFSEADINRLREVAKERNYEIVLRPGRSLDPMFARLTSGRDLDELIANYPIDISPPTDNKPFFFNMLKTKSLFEPNLWENRPNKAHLKAHWVLGTLLLIVIALTVLCILVPLSLTTEKRALKGATPFLMFFAAIGFGFMLVEISQMQRLIIFLGHPTYGLSVVLFSILLSSGIGSYTTQTVENPQGSRTALLRLALLVVVIFLFGLITPAIVNHFDSSGNAVRIAMAVVILFPLGLFMGMAFPLGMQLAASRKLALTPWFWGINGATSVCASVLAVAIALAFGIAAAFWCGFACYIVALLSFQRASRSAPA